MTTLINLTPHPIRIYAPDTPGRVDDTVRPVRIIYPADQPPARVAELEIGHYDLDGISVELLQPGRVTDLPPYAGHMDSLDRETWYVVSRPVALSEPRRGDLLVPYREVRDLHGSTIGCRQLARLT